MLRGIGDMEPKGIQFKRVGIGTAIWPNLLANDDSGAASGFDPSLNRQGSTRSQRGRIGDLHGIIGSIKKKRREVEIAGLWNSIHRNTAVEGCSIEQLSRIPVARDIIYSRSSSFLKRPVCADRWRRLNSCSECHTPNGTRPPAIHVRIIYH